MLTHLTHETFGSNSGQHRMIWVVVLLFHFAWYITLTLGHDRFLLHLSWAIINPLPANVENMVSS